MKPHRKYLLILATLFVAISGCKKKSEVNLPNYTAKMGGPRIWHGEEYVFGKFYRTVLNDTLEFIIVDAKTIKINAGFYSQIDEFGWTDRPITIPYKHTDTAAKTYVFEITQPSTVAVVDDEITVTYNYENGNMSYYRSMPSDMGGEDIKINTP